LNFAAISPIRGDDRGSIYISFLSPAQLISVLFVLFALVDITINYVKARNKNEIVFKNIF